MPKANFPTTHWSRIGALKDTNSEHRHQALEFMAERYWRPIHSFVLRSGVSPDEAQDFTQSFFKFALETNLFAKAVPEHGRFRNLLCRSIKNFLLNEWRAQHAAKRMPSGGLVPMDDLDRSNGLAFDPPDTRSPEDAFDRAWAHALLERAAEVLKTEYQAKGMGLHFELFMDRVLNPILRQSAPTSYEELARRYGTAMKKIDTCLITARRRFSSLVRSEVQHYCHSEEDVGSELQWLYDCIVQN